MPTSAARGPLKPRFFVSPSRWREWLERHHDAVSELWVGFYKKDTGRASITWPQAVDAALCFGWIDGVRKRRDAASYVIRFTPRQTRSIWSAINLRRARQLARLGVMRPPGLRALRARAASQTGLYSYEQRDAATLATADERRFRANRKAWQFFQGQPAGYRRTTIWWVVSPKQQETRARRLATLIADSATGRPEAPFRRASR